MITNKGGSIQCALDQQEQQKVKYARIAAKNWFLSAGYTKKNALSVKRI